LSVRLLDDLLEFRRASGSIWSLPKESETTPERMTLATVIIAILSAVCVVVLIRLWRNQQ